MQLNINIDGRKDTERILSIIQLGMITALENKVITIEEIEGYLFSPFTIERLEKYGLDDNVVDIIKDGCELEDVESLAPENLAIEINNLKEKILKNIHIIEKPELPTQRIIK